MSFQVRDLVQRGIRPNGDVIMGEPMGRHDFLVLFGPVKGRHLGLGRNGGSFTPRRRVPKMNVFVIGAASRTQ